MGLENLKSVFNQNVGNTTSQPDGGIAKAPTDLNFDTLLPTPVDFLTNNIKGFTIDFDNKGGGLGTSKFVGQFSEFNDNQTLGFNKFQQSIDFMNEAQNNPTSISGFDTNFDNKGEGLGTSKYIGQISELANNQTIGFTPLVQPPNLKQNIGLQTIGENANIFDEQGNFKYVETGQANDKSIQFNTLYGKKQTTKEIKKGSDRLRLRAETPNDTVSLLGLSNPFSGKLNNRGNEPYVVSEIGGNVAGRDFPIERSLLDAQRIIRFMTSQAGLFFIAKQNLLGVNTKVITTQYLPDTTQIGAVEPKKIGRRQRFQTSYNPLSTLGSLVRTLGGQVPNVGFGFLLNREDPFPLDPTRTLLPRNYMDSIATRKITSLGFAPGSQEEEFTSPVLNETAAGLFSDIASTFGPGVPRDFPKRGDKMTLSNMIKGDNLTSLPALKTSTFNIGNPFNVPTAETLNNLTSNSAETNIESQEAGLPFYFKDLRDNTYVFLRGYLSGITENISPSWASENYIGRSEPVYIYERAEREISFTLKIFATTKDELPMIYKKMNRLTSMCYPEYVEDTLLDNKLRMKPPLVKFRMGEMYGSENKELTGWLKSISYTVPDNSVWETSKGKRVVKHVEANIGFQVIHNSPPNLKTKFYGFVGD